MYRVSTDHDPGNLPNDTRRVLRERTFEPRSENNYDGSPSIQNTSSFTHCQPPTADFSKTGDTRRKHAKIERTSILQNRLPAAPPKPNRRPLIKAQNARFGFQSSTIRPQCLIRHVQPGCACRNITSISRFISLNVACIAAHAAQLRVFE